MQSAQAPVVGAFVVSGVLNGQLGPRVNVAVVDRLPLTVADLPAQDECSDKDVYHVAALVHGVLCECTWHSTPALQHPSWAQDRSRWAREALVEVVNTILFSGCGGPWHEFSDPTDVYTAQTCKHCPVVKPEGYRHDVVDMAKRFESAGLTRECVAEIIRQRSN